MNHYIPTIITASVVAVASIFSPGLEAQTAATHFNACVSSPSQSAGLYQFATDSYAPLQLKRNIYASGGGVANDNYYYTVRYENVGGIPVFERNSYSLKNYGVEDSYPSGSIQNVATDIAYFAPRDEAYGCFFNENGDGYVFGKYRFGYWLCNKICDIPVAFAALDFDSKGTLYAIDWTGKLLTVDTATGAQTVIGDTGLTTDMITGGAIDRNTDTFYYSIHQTGASAIYTVDLATAKATKAYDLENDEQVGGIYFPVTYDNASPAAASNPTLNFSSGSLTGTVRFRAPQKTVGGEIAGDVNYHILANGTEVAAGTTNYDAGFQSVEVTLAAPGQYCISLQFSNAAGMGPRSKTSQWIGPDTPKAPGNPRVTYKDGVAKLFWTAVGSTGVNGGSINTSGLVYKITRHPDMVEAEASASGWTETLEMPATRTTYKYEIKAVAGGIEGESSFSPEFSLGPIVPPYSESFPTIYSSFGWKWINNDSYIDDNYSQSNGMRLVTMNMPDEGVYMVTPPVALKAKSSYEISFNARCGNSTSTETFDLIAGTSDDAEGLEAITLLKGTVLESTTLASFSTTFVPEESANHYIAFKGTQSGKMLYVKDFNIGKGVSKGTPAEVTGLTLAADETGAHKATATFSLPLLDSDGGALDQIIKVELLRDGTAVATLEEGLTPGAEMIMTDETEPAVGMHTYAVVCYNENGNGTPVSDEVWVGFNEPWPLEWVKLVENETIGTVTITWAPVDIDIDGKKLSEEDVTYTVYNREGDVVRSGMTERTLSLFVCDPAAEQQWTQFRVSAQSEGGLSEPAKSMLVPVGKPAAAPWHESWPGKEATQLIGTTKNNVDDQWMVVGGFSYNGRNVDPQDNDGGMMGLENRLQDEPVALFTGKIDLSTIAEPAFSFWVFNYIGDNGKDNENELNVMAYGSKDDEFKSIEVIKIGETGPAMQWNQVIVPLSAYNDDVVRLRIEAAVRTAIYVHIDNLSVDTHSSCNVAARNIIAPAAVDADSEFAISLDIVNTGASDVKDIEVKLHHNGEAIATRKVSYVAAGATKNVSFAHILSHLADDLNTYHFEISAEGDNVAADNVSAAATVALRRSGMPMPQNLKATKSGEAVLLQWEEPDYSLQPAVASTESFEKAAAWKSEVAGWTMVDYDGATIGGIGKKQLPVSGQQSFFVIDDTYNELNYSNDGTRFKAHSGHHSLWSMYSMRGNYYIQSDDWAISPELYGGPQTISLWASSFLADEGQTQYLETFEVLASSTGIDKADFSLIDRIANVPATWTQYDFYLPQGTKYVAIRGISYDKYILMIDDVTLRLAGAATENIDVAGYDIWRDGVKLNSATVAATSYTDASVEHATAYTYRVTAVYSDKTVSAATGPVSIEFLSGISLTDAGVPVVSTAKGQIVIANAAGTVGIYRIDGTTVYSGEADGTLTVDVATGAYIVRVGTYCTKVLVK